MFELIDKKSYLIIYVNYVKLGGHTSLIHFIIKIQTQLKTLLIIISSTITAHNLTKSYNS